MREINEVIIHCSQTPVGAIVTTEDIRGWHLKRGFKDIGYHYVIYRNGSVHKGRPINEEGAHWGGRNHKTIDICYIGGQDNLLRFKDTRTWEQRISLNLLLVALKLRFPGIVINGHNKYSNRSCPCFDVKTDPYCQV